VAAWRSTLTAGPAQRPAGNQHPFSTGCYYTLLLLVLTWLSPGYRGIAWNLHGPAAVRLCGLPLTELLFGLCFGLYWSGLLEQLAWLFVVPAPAG
jgi:hypothetical protein